jgi:hypothetical protein
MEIIKSNKCKDVLVYEGFIYTWNVKKDVKVYWICQDQKCNASAITSINYTTDQEVKVRGAFETTDNFLIVSTP